MRALSWMATDLPVSADLEKGFGDAPAAAAETIPPCRRGRLVGGSIEDATGDKDRPLYDLDTPARRVAAALGRRAHCPSPLP